MNYCNPNKSNPLCYITSPSSSSFASNKSNPLCYITSPSSSSFASSPLSTSFSSTFPSFHSLIPLVSYVCPGQFSKCLGGQIKPEKKTSFVQYANQKNCVCAYIYIRISCMGRNEARTWAQSTLIERNPPQAPRGGYLCGRYPFKSLE